jgi:hypothetical protein
VQVCVRLAFGVTLGLRHRYVAEVVNFEADFGQAGVQVRHAYRRRSHVDATASGPEIERNTDDRDVGMAHD